MAAIHIASRNDGNPRTGRRMGSRVAGPGFTLGFCAMSAAQAQVTIDIAKVTCEQFVQYRITNDENVAVWLHGYYNAKHGSTIVDPQRLKANVSRVREYCTMNSDVTVLQALGTVLGTGK